MAGFQREIGGDEEFVAAGWGEDGAVVADAQAEMAGAWLGCPRPDVGDQGEFSGWAGGWTGHESFRIRRLRVKACV
jgi:hypothetical protein